MQKSRVVWIDWGRHARTRSLVARLGIELLEVDIGGRRLRRYARCVSETMRFLRRLRPTVVVVTNPSIVLCCLAMLVRPLFGFRLFCDAHFFGVKALGGSALHQRALDYLNRRFDLVIVTNDNHARYLDRLGARTFVCQDPLPSIPSISPPATPLAQRSVFLICSFDEDEPYEAVFEAFDGLREEGFVLFVSGNMLKARVDLSQYDWVKFLGFVPDDEYFRYLLLCDVVVDLTTNEDCLVCGAYEAIAAEKPLVVSRTAAITSYFGSVAVLTEHDPDSIRTGVRKAYAGRVGMAESMRVWAAENEVYMAQRIAQLSALAHCG